MTEYSSNQHIRKEWTEKLRRREEYPQNATSTEAWKHAAQRFPTLGAVRS